MPSQAPPNLLNPDGTPKLTTSQRRSQLDETRFVDVRHLAYLNYKKPDETPLMEYHDTLDNRDLVKAAVLNHEVTLGWVLRDGTEGQSPQAAQPQTLAQPGVQMSNIPFSPPPNGAPQQQMMQAPQQQQFAPPPGGGVPFGAPPPQQQFAPPQQQQMQMPMPPAQPQMQMQAPQQQAPAQQSGPAPQDPPAAPPTGRRRKGAAVAPPPGAPVPQQQMQAPAQQQAPQMQFAPPQGQQAPQGAPAPQFAAAPTLPQFTPPGNGLPSQGAPAPQAPASVDLTPLIGRIDALAGLVTNLTKETTEQKMLLLKSMAVLHHMYLVNPAFQPQAGAQPLPRTLPEFSTFLAQFVGTPT